MATKTLIELTEATFDRDAGTGTVLVDFWAPWCGPCRMQAPALEMVADSFSGKATVAKVNVDENPSLAARFRVSGIPLLVILKDGQEVRRFVGVQTPQVLASALQQAL